jgi:long-chain acyl-CoA synthetase
MHYDRWTSLATMFFEQAAKYGEKPFLWAKQNDAYRPLSWTAAAQQASLLSRGLRALGVQPGDRVVLVSENRPEWLIADIAIMAAGAITVPAYTTNPVADHQHVLDNSGARAAIVSTAALAERLLPAARRAAELKTVIHLEPVPAPQQEGPQLVGWDEALALGGKSEDDVAEVAGRAARKDTACIIYTSGTGGAPKGVMLSHGAILSNCLGAYQLLLDLGLEEEVFLSFLPLSHAYEHMAGQFFPISIGAQIYYAESIDRLAKNLTEVRPTIMTAVPRLFEALRERILIGVRRSGGVKEKLFTAALDLGRRSYEEPDSLSLTERIENAALDRLVRSKVRARFGGRLKALVSGGAALNYEVGLFFTTLGLCLLQGYGQTEAAPLISCNPPSRAKLKTVGPPVQGVEVRIAEDGEILARGELLMNGYWRNEESTAEAICEGWLHTGDIGEFDEDGYLSITDRKKDIIVASSGDNLSPNRLEGMLTLAPEIEQAMVYGDARPYIVALLVPNEHWRQTWAEAHGKPGDSAELAADTDFRAALREAVEQVNKGLAVFEKIRRFTVAHEPFTTDNEMMTPTMKLRRHKILERYGKQIAALY